jgi:CRP-like cAMP-binding protein
MTTLVEARSQSLSRFLVSYPAGARIYREGEIGTDMFIIRAGEVEITRIVQGETLTLARLGKGDFFGEMSLLEEMPREATARTRTDVELIRVDGASFEEMLRRNPEIAVAMMRRLSRQAREAAAFVDEALGARKAVPRQAAAADLGAQLVAPDRKIRFPLNREGDTIIGRADPLSGASPDVDLTALDSQRTVSRRHARLYAIGETMYVMEEIGVVNGTFVNDVRLTTGAPSVLRHGDDLKLGFVTLTFWHPAA